jgi:MFS family permease
MHGLYLQWWVQEKHVPTAAVATILTAGDLALTALEVPTGWLADRLGHRTSLLAGSLLQVAGMLLCWLGRGIPGLLAASLFVALGDAFRSGADQALLYRSCAALGRDGDFQPIEAKARALQLAAMVVLILAGGAIVQTWGFAIGWMVETAVSAVGLAIACAMVEPGSAMVEPAARVDHTAPHGRSARQPGATDRQRRRWGQWAALILPASLLGGAASAASFLAQTSGGRGPARMSMLVAAITLAEATGSAFAARVNATGVRVQMALAGLGAAAIAQTLLLPATFLPDSLPDFLLGSLPVVVGLSLLIGLAHPLRAAAIQRLAADDVRARTASIANACDKAFMTMALVFAGVWPRRR